MHLTFSHSSLKRDREPMRESQCFLMQATMFIALTCGVYGNAKTAFLNLNGWLPAPSFWTVKAHGAGGWLERESITQVKWYGVMGTLSQCCKKLSAIGPKW